MPFHLLAAAGAGAVVLLSRAGREFGKVSKSVSVFLFDSFSYANVQRSSDFRGKERAYNICTMQEKNESRISGETSKAY